MNDQFLDDDIDESYINLIPENSVNFLPLKSRELYRTTFI